MKKKLYLEINLPDDVNFEKMEIEQLIYNELFYRLEELNVPKSVMDDWKQFDVICKDIKHYTKDF